MFYTIGSLVALVVAVTWAIWMSNPSARHRFNFPNTLLATLVIAASFFLWPLIFVGLAFVALVKFVKWLRNETESRGPG